jgi:hypothetical protein
VDADAVRRSERTPHAVMRRCDYMRMPLRGDPTKCGCRHAAIRVDADAVRRSDRKPPAVMRRCDYVRMPLRGDPSGCGCREAIRSWTACRHTAMRSDANAVRRFDCKPHAAMRRCDHVRMPCGDPSVNRMPSRGDASACGCRHAAIRSHAGAVTRRFDRSERMPSRRSSAVRCRAAAF